MLDVMRVDRILPILLAGSFAVGCTSQSASVVEKPTVATVTLARVESPNLEWRNTPKIASIRLSDLDWNVPTINTCQFRDPEGYDFSHQVTGELLADVENFEIPRIIPPWLWGEFHTRGRSCLIFHIIGDHTQPTAWSLEDSLPRSGGDNFLGGRWIAFSPNDRRRETHMQLLLLHPSNGNGDWGGMLDFVRTGIGAARVQLLEYTIELPDGQIGNYLISVSTAGVQQELHIPLVRLKGQTIRPGLRIVLRPEPTPSALRDLLKKQPRPAWRDVVTAFPRAFVLGHWLARS